MIELRGEGVAYNTLSDVQSQTPPPEPLFPFFDFCPLKILRQLCNVPTWPGDVLFYPRWIPSHQSPDNENPPLITLALSPPYLFRSSIYLLSLTHTIFIALFLLKNLYHLTLISYYQFLLSISPHSLLTLLSTFDITLFLLSHPSTLLEINK